MTEPKINYCPSCERPKPTDEQWEATASGGGAELGLCWEEACMMRPEDDGRPSYQDLRAALELIAACPPDAVHLMPLAAQAALSGLRPPLDPNP